MKPVRISRSIRSPRKYHCPRRSRRSQPNSAGALGHLVIARLTISSTMARSLPVAESSLYLTTKARRHGEEKRLIRRQERRGRREYAGVAARPLRFAAGSPLLQACLSVFRVSVPQWFNRLRPGRLPSARRNARGGSPCHPVG